MDISFKNRKIEKEFNEGARLQKTHGKLRADKIKRRMAELRAAQNLKDFWPPKSGPSRCHELTEGNRRGQISMNLDHPYRLIFVPNHDPVPRLQNKELDWLKVTAITIIGIEDTHD